MLAKARLRHLLRKPDIFEPSMESAMNATQAMLTTMYEDMVAVAHAAIDQNRETLATALVDRNPECLVPATSNEFFDCCGAPATEKTCYIFGLVNVAILGIFVVTIIVLLLQNRWLSNQWLLKFALFF